MNVKKQAKLIYKIKRFISLYDVIFFINKKLTVEVKVRAIPIAAYFTTLLYLAIPKTRQ